MGSDAEDLYLVILDVDLELPVNSGRMYVEES